MMTQGNQPRTRITLLAALLAGVMAVPVRHGIAADPTLAINPGLWEYTPAATPLPADVLAALPPDQRAKAAALAKLAPRAYKMCITPQQIKDGPKLAQRAMPGCQRTVVASSPTLLELRDQCSGAMTGTITVRIAAPAPDTLRVTSDAEMSQSGQTHSMKQTLAGKWLGADCGDVKPGAAKAE